MLTTTSAGAPGRRRDPGRPGRADRPAAAGAVVGQRGQGRRPPLLRPRARRRGRSSWRRGRSPCTGSTSTGSSRPTPDLVDVDVTVACTAGTYIRAIARDAGAALGVGRPPHRAAAHDLRALLRRRRRTGRGGRRGAAGRRRSRLPRAGRRRRPPSSRAATLTAEETRALFYGQRIPATGAPGLHAAPRSRRPAGRRSLEDAGSTARVPSASPRPANYAVAGRPAAPGPAARRRPR